MIVTAIKGFTNVLGAPKGWDSTVNGECFGLPVKIEPYGDNRSFTSAWKPDAEEMLSLLGGAEIHLRVIGGQPPVSMHVEGVGERLETNFSEVQLRREQLLAMVVRLCGVQFHTYAASHAAKGTLDGDEKAETNRKLAEICANALEGTPPPPADNGYAEAFYDLAKMMDIRARVKSPAEVWATEMRPRLEAMLAQTGGAAG